MPLGSNINVDPATGATPQTVAAESIGTAPAKLYQGILICDAAGNVVGSTTNPMQVGDAGGSLTVDAPATAPVRTSEQPLNRVDCSFRALQVTAVTNEALLSLTPNRGGAADGTAATSHAPTAGKDLLLTSLIVSMRNTATAAVVPIDFFVRWSTAALAVTSPIIAHASAVNGAATLQTGDRIAVPLDIEVPAGTNFGITHISRNTVNATLNCVLVGYEYTP